MSNAAAAWATVRAGAARGLDIDWSGGWATDRVAARTDRDRQREREGAAVAERGVDPDSTAVVLHDLSADGQAESGALGLVRECVTDLLELFEDLGLIDQRDADARILHAHQ